MLLFKGKFVRTKRMLMAAWWRGKYLLTPPSFPKNADDKVYVNIGCGINTGPEFINIDAVPQAKTHIVADARTLPMFGNDSVDLIYASHVLEHVPRSDLEQTLTEWCRVLHPGGVLRFGVPDFDQLIHMYERSGRKTERIVDQLMGQDGEFDDHHSIWNRAFAEQLLTRAGFKSVREWNPATADHHAFSDKTSRVYEIEGERIPLSLNLEAVK